MAASHFFSEQGVTLLGIESTYGTADTTPTRAAVDVKQSDLTFAQGSVAPMNDSIRPWKTQVPIVGPKSGTGKIVMELRPFAAQLLSGVTPTENYVQQSLKAIMGGHIADSGSLGVAAGSSATVLNVTGGTGTDFRRGTWIGVEISSALEYTRVKEIATDAITPSPSLSAACTNGGVVVNSDTFYLSHANTQSLTIQHAKVLDTNWAWTATGCTGDLEIMVDANKLLQFAINVRFPNWTKSTAAAASPALDTAIVTAFTETLATQMLVSAPMTCLLQSISTLTKTHYPIEVSGFKLNIGGLGNTHIAQLGGGVQNTTGVIRLPNREANTLELTVPADTAFDSGFTANTKYQIVLQVLSGTGITQRAAIIDCPTAVLTETPGKANAGDSRMTTTLKFKLLENEISTISGLTNGTAAMEIATSPVIISLL